MKQKLLRLTLMGVAMMLMGTNSAMAADGDVIFHETFDDCSGTGGNDGSWDGTSTATKTYSKTGWTLTNAYTGDRCIKLGAAKKQGSLVTAGIAFESGKTYTLIFRVGAWSADTDKKVKASLSKGKIDDGNSKEFALTAGSFTIYSATVTEAVANATLTIKANTTNSNRFFLDDIMIVEGDKVNVTIASSGWSSLSTPVGLDFSTATPSGLTAFAATEAAGSGVTLTSVDEAPAAVGVMLKGTPGTTYSIPVKAAATYAVTNKLSAAISATPVDANEVYILKNGMLCLVTGGGTSVPYGKAYLLASEISGGARELTFSFEETTDIRSLTPALSPMGEGSVYDLSGRRVDNPTKGIYIVNGKKVVVK